MRGDRSAGSFARERISLQIAIKFLSDSFRSSRLVLSLGVRKPLWCGRKVSLMSDPIKELRRWLDGAAKGSIDSELQPTLVKFLAAA